MLGIEHYPGVRKFLENPAYTEFWSLQAVDKWLAAQPLTVPTMLEVGQWDQEDSYGAPAVYRALEPKDMSNDMLSRCVIGPWRHSGANHYGYDLGALTFTGDTALEWRAQLCEAVLRSLSEGRCRIRTRRRCSPMRRASTSGRAHRAGRWARDAYLSGRQRRGDFRAPGKRPAMTNTSAIPPNRCRSFRARST